MMKWLICLLLPVIALQSYANDNANPYDVQVNVISEKEQFKIQASYVEIVRIGNCIELQRYIDDDIEVVMMVDETGALDRDAPNYVASMLYGFPVHNTVIHGKALLCGIDECGRGDIVSIPEKFNDIDFWETELKSIEKL